MSGIELTPDLSRRFLGRMMSALAVFHATGNGDAMHEGMEALNAYRCAFRGEKNEEEQAMAAKRALQRIELWSDGPSKAASEANIDE